MTSIIKFSESYIQAYALYAYKTMLSILDAISAKLKNELGGTQPRGPSQLADLWKIKV